MLNDEKPGTDLVEFIGAVHPLRTDIVRMELPEGATLLEMLTIAQPDPGLLIDAYIFVDDIEIPRENWAVVRPRAGHLVTARVIPYLRGGDKGGILRTLLSIAVIATVIFFPEFALAATLTGVAGNLLINALVPVKGPVTDETKEASPAITGASNAARPFGTVPQVLGFYRFRPPLAAATFTENIGDDVHLRMLVTPGYGRLDLSNWEIDETPLANFDDVVLETREGVVGDAPMTLYGNQVDQQDFSIKLLQPDGFTTRTSDLNADELSVDIVWPLGLVFFNRRGRRIGNLVTFTIEFRKVGDVTWLAIPANKTTNFPLSGFSGNQVTFVAARSEAIRKGIRWTPAERGQYEVRIRRDTADSTNDKEINEFFWGALRTFTLDDPINFRVPLSKAALKIRGTEQLNGTLRSLSVLAKSYAQDFTGTPGVWTEAITNNPASLFRHVLQGAAKAVPVADAFIDEPKLEEWHAFCVTNGFTFNQIRDFPASVQSTLEDICAAGRAGLTRVDGKWSVVIDQSVPTITTHITPRNSTGFQLEKSFDRQPHAWRFRFPNEDTRFEQDEVLVFFDGFSVDGLAPGTVIATEFVDLDLPGVTNATQAFRLGRYFAAVAVNRPERWSVTQDFESIVAKRGSRVRLTHDVMVVGLSSGRISALTDDGSGNIETITVDEPVFMDLGKLYGIVIRRDMPGDTSIIAQVVTTPGQQSVLTLVTAIPTATAPEVGDLFGFGLRGTEVEEAIVVANIPEDDFSAKVIMVPYREAVFNADTETVPPFTPIVSGAAFLPAPIIDQIVTDESVLEIGAGNTTLVRAELRAQPIADATAFLEVQQRITGTGEPFVNSKIVFSERELVRVGDVSTGDTVDFRARWNSLERLLPSPYTQTSPTRIVGLSTPPAGLINLNLSVFGGQVLLRWDQPDELDVRFGGTIKFRHTAELVTPLWQNSSSIGQSVNAATLFSTLPLKSGTYLARVFDADGNPSAIVSVNTKQASILQFANVSSLDEAPLFVGTNLNTVSNEGTLRLDGAALIDTAADWDAIQNFDAFGGIITLPTEGVYTFATGFDLGTVKRVRLTTRLVVSSVNVNVFIDDRVELMDDWEDFDGTEQSEADLILEVRQTDDDPAASPTWSEFNRLDSAEFEARGFEFRARLFTNDAAFNILCTTLGVDVEEIV